ncbi:pantoate--beta-alanine ligase [Hydrogenispora ethanolica]|uniref:Pantothenate synthetase n=1 Tax=Hydrogenispora ethanolica TaxID=1082276 RepID=A0A4R1RYL9_HYDET|nr:pantoate--beta-alanine ligase [Hydrogenispora ethanolica]TCL71614.1 pantoate--beta-alanine ligase [Hydrogenispora ethanolica]
MKTIRSIAALQEEIREARRRGESVGFVPTMGYFHEGHLSLMRRARRENGLVVVSLFVNSLQFGPNEDFAKYPRDLDRDAQMAEGTGVDLLFHPEAAEMYPEGFQTTVTVGELTEGLCGASRPGHFQGVATVVLKLFHIVQPDRAYFGEKDAQQLRVIRRMARDLNLGLAVVGCPIVREPDGLALSSRNIFLAPAERQAALVLYRTLQRAGELLAAGERDSTALRRELFTVLDGEPLAELDYLAIVDSDTLQPRQPLAGTILVALAVRIGKTRLIDNLTFAITN